MFTDHKDGKDNGHDDDDDAVDNNIDSNKRARVWYLIDKWRENRKKKEGKLTGNNNIKQ